MIAVECVASDKKGLFVLHLNGEPWRKISTAVFGPSPMFQLQYPSTNDFLQEFLKKEEAGSKVFLARKLAVKSKTVKELTTALKQQGVTEETIAKTLAYFQKLGYVDDEAWLKSFIRAQMQKKKSRRMIQVQLLAKGFAADSFEEILHDFFSSNPEELSIRALLNKKFPQFDTNNAQMRQKAIGFLIRKGFGYEKIQTILHGDDEWLQ